MTQTMYAHVNKQQQQEYMRGEKKKKFQFSWYEVSVHMFQSYFEASVLLTINRNQT
jgi:hypothetical protein